MSVTAGGVTQDDRAAEIASLRALIAALLIAALLPFPAAAQQAVPVPGLPTPTTDLRPLLMQIQVVYLRQDVLHERLVEIDKKVTDMARSLEEHRAEARAAKRWIVKHWPKVISAVSGIIAGFLVKRKPPTTDQ